MFVGMKDLGSVVKEIVYLRKKLGMNQTDLARKAGVSQSLIAKIESSWSRPTKGKRIQPSYEVVRRVYNTLLSEYYKDQKAKTVREVMSRHIVSVGVNDSVKKAVKVMKEKDFSQLPVKDGDSYVGSIVSNDLLDVEDKAKKKVRDVMGPGFEVVLDTIPVKSAREFMRGLKRKALLVKDSQTGRIVGIITPHDVM